MKKKLGGISTRSLIIILVILILVIIGLVIGIILNTNKTKKCLKYDNPYETNECIIDNFGGNEGAMDASYSHAINKAIVDNNEISIITLVTKRSEYYQLNDNCPKALSLLNDDVIDGLSDTHKALFYSFAAGIAGSCDSDELSNYYNKKIDDTYKNGKVQYVYFF